MRRVTPSLVLTLLAAGQAGAGVVEIWTRRSIQFTNLGRAEVSATATGLATLNTSSATSSHLSSLTLPFDPELSISAAVPITNPSVTIQTALDPSIRHRPDLQGGGVLGNISGAIASSAGGLTPNTIPATGGYTVCLLVAPLPPCVAQLSLPVGETQAGLYVGSGVGGVMTLGSSIRISIVGAPYTVKTVSAVNRTPDEALEVVVEHGFAHGPASLTASTAQTSGVLQVVTANRTTIIGPGSGDLSGNISRTLIHVIPEPSLLILFGAGAAWLAWLGWRLSTRRRRGTP